MIVLDFVRVYYTENLLFHICDLNIIILDFIFIGGYKEILEFDVISMYHPH